MNPIPWCAFKGAIRQAYCYSFNVVYWLAAHLHQGDVLERFQAMLKWVLYRLPASSFFFLAPGAVIWHADVKDADSAAALSWILKKIVAEASDFTPGETLMWDTDGGGGLQEGGLERRRSEREKTTESSQEPEKI